MLHVDLYSHWLHSYFTPSIFAYLCLVISLLHVALYPHLSHSYLTPFMFTLLVKIKTTFNSIIVITLITLIFPIFLMLPVTTLDWSVETLFYVLLPSVECVWLNNIFNALFLQDTIHHQFLPCIQEDIQLLLSHFTNL